MLEDLCTTFLGNFARVVFTIGIHNDNLIRPTQAFSEHPLNPLLLVSCYDRCAYSWGVHLVTSRSNIILVSGNIKAQVSFVEICMLVGQPMAELFNYPRQFNMNVISTLTFRNFLFCIEVHAACIQEPGSRRTCLKKGACA